MKDSIRLSTFFLIIAILASCTPKAPENNQSEALKTDTTPAFQEKEAVISIGGLWFREEENGKGTRQLDIGEKVTIIGEEVVNAEDSNRKSMPIRLYDGSEGFASSWFVIPDAVPGVLISKARIYSEPKSTKATSMEPLPELKIIAVKPENSMDNFLEIYYANDKGYARWEEYIKADTVSLETRDINAARLYNLAMAQTDADMKQEFLQSAMEEQSGAFGELIREAYNMNTGSESDIPTEKTAMVTAEEAALHAKPLASSEVTGYQYQGTILAITARSNNQEDVDGIQDYWYELAAGGWIFGGNIELRD